MTTQLNRMPKYMIILSMFYLTAFIFPVMLAYRMVSVGSFLLPGGTLFFPASYLIGDIIAEVYGYQVARQLVWSAIFCQLLICSLIIIVLHLPFPSNWLYEQDFDIVLGHSLRYAIASTVGNFLGEFVNIYIISKFKILLKGRYYWLRSLGASCIGEAVLTSTVFFITFVGVTSLQNIFALTLSGYLFKILFSVLALFPITYLVSFLKRNERIDVCDQGLDFNPFKFSVDNESVLSKKE